MKLIRIIRSSISLKVSLGLSALTIVLTSIAAYAIISREAAALEEQTVTKAKLAAKLGAHAYGRTLEEAIENEILTVQDVFDVNYQEIKGYPFGKSPRYHTRYDFYTDAHVMEMQDQFFDSPDVVVAVGADINGYVPTHNGKSMKPLGNEADKNIEGNRSKRFYTDPAAVKASKSEVPLVQKYRRDTGAWTLLVSSPVFVQGKHWGCFRVLVSVETLEAQRMALLVALAGMFGLFVLATGLAIFLMVRRSMRPLGELTTLADNLSLGDGLDTPIRPATTDEVGRMTKSIDRLRASLQAAMNRIGE